MQGVLKYKNSKYVYREECFTKLCACPVWWHLPAVPIHGK